ncbi:hypothetical protein AB0K02_14480 [Streptomyces sp. NPDC049597]|uniref:hypothetical protein n=1 Tax=Streptomyces sp. NPDC049597 TaxID=3155276 RepID=UPI003441D878
MRVSQRCVGLAGAAVVGLLTLSPSAAWADGAPAAGAGPSNVRVSPGQVHQGATLSVTVSGCPGGGTVSSAAFPTVTLPAGATTVTARVDNTATPGAARLTVHCGGRTAHATFTVLAGAAAQGGLGGSYAPGTGEIAAGAALTGMAAAAAGAVLLRRRSSGRV